MLRVKAGVIVNRSVEKIWIFVSDLDNFARWNYGEFKAKQTSEGPLGVGSTFQTQRQFLGQQQIETVRVSEYVPNRALAFQFGEGSFSGTNRLTFESVGVGTQIVSISEVKLNGWLKVTTPILTFVLTQLASGNLAKLKNVIEATA